MGPATDTLEEMAAAGEIESFDFCFIDADKRNHDNYYELVLPLVRGGGLIVFDNVFWDGLVVDPNESGPDVETIRALNKKLGDDTRIDIATVPLGDGVTVARKK